MEISTKYNPRETEDKWYKYWTDNKLFRSEPDDREPYTIVIPPPNVTGVLHMGHMLNNTMQDVMIRRARMQGKNACWVPGTDHASIATEAKVVAKLKDEGIDKADLTRDEFMTHAWQWKEKHGGIILEQLKKLGASCDWDRTAFTMDEELYRSVIKVFVDLYNKGKVYRGVRMVNWDPSAKTAVSDEEVYHQEEQSKLYYVNYKVVGEDKTITIATTRPETILGDTAVCINPEDERFTHLKGKKVIVPLVNREVPIIEDSYVDMEFGTGCLKITPAHDVNDYEIGMRHNLETIDILNDDGTLSEAAQFFVGIDRAEARKLAAKQLEEEGYLLKTEDYTNKVGYSERTKSVIEPKLSMQWFLKMEELAKPALDNVMNDNIQFFPPKFKNTYRHWMENVRDWCISRQLWWGQRIPVWYINGTNDFVVAENEAEALKMAQEKTNNNSLTADQLKQDEDVLDTWFSSWLWPISVFNGINEPENEEIKYYYPTNDLITGPDIIFFWVARMIVAGYEYKDERPFKKVCFTGLVRDDKRRKMSKSLGNSPDPLQLIEKYGADGIRVGMLLCSPAGNDLLFDENLPEQGRNFGNKIWNAFRLVNSWEVDSTIEQPEAAQQGIAWFGEKIKEVTATLEMQYDGYRLSEALMSVYRLFWDDFSSWYLEIVKPAYQQPIDKATLEATKAFFDQLLRLLHPFMPFITEELWQALSKRKAGDSISIAAMPTDMDANTELIAKFEDVKEIITKIRSIRKDKNIPQKESLNLQVKENGDYDSYFEKVIIKSNNLESITLVDEKDEGAASFMVKTTEFFVPIGDKLNIEEELQKLNEQLKYNQGFLKSVDKKLSNARFVDNAPTAVVDKEKAKKADAESNIKAIEAQISSMKKMQA